MPFLMIFLSIPLIEIALFILVGGAIGAGWTILLVVGSAVLGSFIIQNQGISSFEATQRALREGHMPQDTVFETLCGLLAGLLLIIPGFFSDMLALALLAPVVRNRLRRRMATHYGVDPASRYSDIITTEYEVVPEDAPESRNNAPHNPRLPDLKP